MRKKKRFIVPPAVTECEKPLGSREPGLNSRFCKVERVGKFLVRTGIVIIFLSFINLQLVGFGQEMNVMYLAGGVLPVFDVEAVDVLC